MLDEVTGKPIYHLDYIDKMKKAGTPVEENKPSELYNEQEIASSSVSEYGSIYFLKQLADTIGLNESIYKMIPALVNEIFYLASFLLCSNEPMMYCEDWMKSTYSKDCKLLTPKFISRLLTSITQEERDTFYSSWLKDKKDGDYLALDITSISSYSTLIDTAGWGYNRDHEELSQINMRMLFSEKNRLPIYQGELKTTLAQMTIQHVKDTILDIDHTIEVNGDTLYASTFSKVITSGKKFILMSIITARKLPELKTV